MINLIPNEEKKMKAKDFYFRLVVVSLAALGLALVIGLAAAAPSLLLSSIDKNFAESKLVAQKSEPITATDEHLSAEAAALNGKLAIVERAETEKYSISRKVINEIVLRKMPDIRITRIWYENVPAGGRKVNIVGVAPSRERLLAFRRALEDDVAFKKVELPISNFVRGSNLEFSIDLIPS